MRSAGGIDYAEAAKDVVVHDVDGVPIPFASPRLLWRTALSHLVYDLAGAFGYLRQGRPGPWLRGKAAAIAGARRVWRQRTRAGAGMTHPLWALMEPDWIGIKRAEKQFDFRPAASVDDQESSNQKPA